MSNPSARHQLVCTIVQRHPESVVALAEAVGMPLPEHDDVTSAPDSHPMAGGNTLYTDASVRLLLKGEPVYFATVEMQRKFGKDKYATLHAYHGSGVRNAGTGGHVFTLSDKASEAARFRAEDAARRAELAFSASFHSGPDLDPLRQAELPLAARALPAALADFGADAAGTREMLGELHDGDLTLANLYLMAILEEVPKTMLGEIVRPDLFEKLRDLEGFREYEAKVLAEGKAEAATRIALADLRVAEAKTQAADAKTQAADAKTQAADAKTQAAQAEARTTARNLTDFLVVRGDNPSKHALAMIGACQSAIVLTDWLNRAYRGETAAQLFPEPKPPAS